MYFLLKFVSFLLVTVFVMTGCVSKKTTAHSIVSTRTSTDTYTLSKTKYTSKAWHKATMKSYKVLGKRYYPTRIKTGKKMYGVSSWYGPNFHGKQTSNGEIYDMHARTAAHKTWPMDTIVHVTNLENGKETTVRINDRGPFVRGRVIDCSYAAGKELGLDILGIAKVKLRVLGIAGEKKVFRKPKKIKKLADKKNHLSLQVGAFSKLEGAEQYKNRYALAFKEYNTFIKQSQENENILYKVWLSGFKTVDEIRAFKTNKLI